jgi:hypothetical protein
MNLLQAATKGEMEKGSSESAAALRQEREKHSQAVQKVPLS